MNEEGQGEERKEREDEHNMDSGRKSDLVIKKLDQDQIQRNKKKSFLKFRNSNEGDQEENNSGSNKFSLNSRERLPSNSLARNQTSNDELQKREDSEKKKKIPGENPYLFEQKPNTPDEEHSEVKEGQNYLPNPKKIHKEFENSYQ